MKQPAIVLAAILLTVAALLIVATPELAPPKLIVGSKLDHSKPPTKGGSEHERQLEEAPPEEPALYLPAARGEADFDEREAGNIEKLKSLKRLAEARTLTAEQLSEILASSEDFWVKAAYLQAAADMSFSKEAAAFALQETLAFLERTGVPAGDDDAMKREAYFKAIALLSTLNAHGVYDAQIKEIYESTRNPDFLKSISDKAYIGDRLDSLDDKTATEIIRERPNGDLVEKARRLAQRAPEERPSLEKYISQYGPVEAWKIENSDDRKTKLMKLNGISASGSPGKVAFVLAQWRDGYYRRLTGTLSQQDHAALANPTYELAYALWTEIDAESRTKAENELYAIFSADFKPTARPSKQVVALVDLAVAYVDTCLSNMLPKPCQEGLHAQQSFARRLAADYLASLLTRGDAAQALGPARSFVEKTATHR